MLRILFVSLLVASAGCFASEPEVKPECSPDDPDNQCASGQVCVSFVCERVCDSVDICEAHEACINQICVPYAQSCGGGETCAEGWYCDGAACRRDQTLGNACGDETECERGFCVDGVCCNDACAGTCMGCTNELTGLETGRCAPIPEGNDPESECGTHRGCDGAGDCLPVDSIGTACTTGETCNSQICVDGVCCDSLCDGECEACVEVATTVSDGLCAPIPPMTDPQFECDGRLCSGVGSCRSEVGGSCSVARECVDGFCSNNQCAAPPTVLPPEPFSPWNGQYIGNVHMPSSLRPRFRWRPSTGGEGVITYDLELGTLCSPGDIQSCQATFSATEQIQLIETDHQPTQPLAVVDSGPVLGTRYYWRVRGCDSLGTCSPWSSIRYFDLGRDRHDFNGDGYADLAVGVPHAGNGDVVLLFGSNSGIVDEVGTTLDAPDPANDSFGMTVTAIGDVNADGWADLAVADPHFDEGTTANVGRVYVYLGGAGGLGASAQVISSPSGRESARFGMTVSAAGDVNSDGYGDFVVGAFNHDGVYSEEGQVFVYLGGSNGITNFPSQILLHPEPGQEGWFGWAIAGAGDWNGDGNTDVAIAGRTELAGFGMAQDKVFTWEGSAVGASLVPSRALQGPNDLTRVGFGSSMSLEGDLNDDGYADLAVAAIGLSNGSDPVGGFFVLFGADTGVSNESYTVTMNPADALTVFGGGAILGNLSAGRDVDGDGYLDVVVSSPTETEFLLENAGAAYLFLGDGSGQYSTHQRLTSPSPAEGAMYSYCLAFVGDMNGDGRSELAVGEDSYLYVHYGEVSGVADTPDHTLSWANPVDLWKE